MLNKNTISGIYCITSKSLHLTKSALQFICSIIEMSLLEIRSHFIRPLLSQRVRN